MPCRGEEAMGRQCREVVRPQEGEGAMDRGGSYGGGKNPTHQAIMHPFCWRDRFMLKIFFFICLNFYL